MIGFLISNWVLPSYMVTDQKALTGGNWSLAKVSVYLCLLPSMKKSADGSLTLYVQKDSPGKDKESNWLPAPDGPIYLVMRLYWPKTEAPSILPAGEGTWKPPGVVVAAK